MWHRRQSKHSQPVIGHLEHREEPVAQHRDAHAYVLLEEARLRCEQLCSEAATSPQGKALQAVHRELGLAGLFASSNIPTQVRQTLLADAHRRCEQPVAETSDQLGGLIVVLLSATHAVEDGLLAPGLSDHINLAHIHVLRGQELLPDHFTARPASQPVRDPRAVK